MYQGGYLRETPSPGNINLKNRNKKLGTAQIRSRRTVLEQQMKYQSARKILLSGHLDSCCKSEATFLIFPFY